mmetsp:Transcript_9637/g.18085  ORF Transcript_9637/g.18085 Transcript_9637/m.18085 type:complete len:338 (-) Transcript_9637:80-1093(-)
MPPKTDSTTTEGFDLDAIPNDGGEDTADVIYELGGGVTIVPPSTGVDPNAQNYHQEHTAVNEHDHGNNHDHNREQFDVDPLAKSEELKQKGNEYFKQGNYLDAIDYYTDAIEACPGIKGEEILMMQQQHEEKEREKASQRYRRDTERKMAHRSNIRGGKDRNDNDMDKDKNNNDNDIDKNNNDNDDDDDLAPEEFQPPVHPHGKHLAIYYSNKAASLMHLDEYSEAMKCCNIAILLDSTYSKAYVRRMTCHEQTQEMELALKDAKMALELNPRNVEIKKHVNRLEKLEAERMEKLKTETMEKLKEIGNSILGNFGMSLDNFKAEKDPNTGSYSIKMV